MKLTKLIGGGLAIFGAVQLIKRAPQFDEKKAKIFVKKKIIDTVEWLIYDEEERKSSKPKAKRYIFSFDSKAKGEAFINELNHRVLQDGFVTVAVAKKQLSHPADTDYFDYQMGWKDLSTVYAKTVKGRYKLYFPKTKEIWR